MADLIINSVTYSGSPVDTSHPQRPKGYKRRRKRIGRTVEGAEGSTSWVHRGFKWEWELSWPKANATTQAAVLAIRNLSATFPLVDHAGASFTAIVVGDDGYEEDITTDRANAYKYGLTLTMREA